MKRKTLFRCVLSAFVDLIIADIVCAVIAFSTISWYEVVFVKVIILVVCQLVLWSMMFTYGYAAGHDELKFFRRKQPVDPNKAIKLALLGVIPLYVFWLVLLLSKLEIIPMNLLPFYQLTCSWMLPVVQMFQAKPDIQLLPWSGMYLFLGLSFMVSVSIYVGYILGYKDVDIKYELMYKKKPKDTKENQK